MFYNSDVLFIWQKIPNLKSSKNTYMSQDMFSEMTFYTCRLRGHRLWAQKAGVVLEEDWQSELYPQSLAIVFREKHISTSHSRGSLQW